MSKRLIIVLALAFVVGLSVAAYAEVQNVKVSGDLNMMGVVRNSFLLDDDGETVTAGVSIARVKIDADLTDNVSTCVRLLNERVFGEEADSASEIDLDLAYVTLKEMLYSPLTVIVGRQELRYGNALIIGDPDTNGALASASSGLTQLTSTNPGLTDLSARKAFDAVRAILNYDPLVLDMFWAKKDENAINTYDDVTLMGINGAYRVDKNLMTEAYYFQKVRQPDGTLLTVGVKPDVVRVLGTRGMYTGIKDMVLGLEGAYQFGTFTDNDLLYPNDTELTSGQSGRRSAWALQAIANFTPAGKKYSPSVTATFTHLSGQKDGSRKSQYTGWDAMCEDQAGGTIFNAITGASNINVTSLSGSMVPMEDVKVTLDYYNLMLDKKFLAGAQFLSGVVTGPTYTMLNKRSIGNEIDLKVAYDYTEDVQLGLNTGWFIPGSAFSKVNRKTASQIIGSMKVTF